MMSKYLFAGGDELIDSGDVIGIFDVDTSSTAKRTREFLRYNEQRGRMKTLGSDLPRSLIVCTGQNYLSMLSPQTLKKRATSIGGAGIPQRGDGSGAAKE